MSELSERDLVIAAIKSGVTGCFEWDDKAAERVRGDIDLQGLTPEGIKTLVRAFVASGGEVKQVKETRPQYSHRDFYFKIVFSEPGFKHGVFVEMELTDPDPELPSVTIFNAHPQTR
ncbi:MAG: hypothetical protein L0215_21720 [Gemmataceae bacterium]|nr:hypothetical protein [Gemmataceae bacterium]